MIFVLCAPNAISFPLAFLHLGDIISYIYFSDLVPYLSRSIPCPAVDIVLFFFLDSRLCDVLGAAKFSPIVRQTAQAYSVFRSREDHFKNLRCVDTILQYILIWQLARALGAKFWALRRTDSVTTKPQNCTRAESNPILICHPNRF